MHTTNTDFRCAKLFLQLFKVCCLTSVLLAITRLEFGFAQSPNFALLYQLNGDNSSHGFGSSVACLENFGTTTGTSILIGAPGPGSVSSFGNADIYDGPTGATLVERQSNANPPFQFGYSVASVGNVAGGSGNDYIVGRPPPFASVSDPGSALVFFDAGSYPANSTLFGTDSLLGFSTAGLFDDSDNDGIDDVIVGSPIGQMSSAAEGGYVMLFDSNQTGGPILEVFASGINDEFGASVSSISDLSGDGIRDILVGAPGANSGAGAVLAFSSVGGAEIFSLGGVSSQDRLGVSLAVLPDLDGDGRQDFAVGAPSVDGLVGYVKVLSYNLGGSVQELCMISTGTASEDLGYSLAAIGDIDGNGTQELAVGAPSANGGIGRVDVHSLPNGGPGPCPVLFSISGSEPDEKFGASLMSPPFPAKSCDLDGDNVPDFAVGSAMIDQSGRVTAYRGVQIATPTPTATITVTPTATATITPTATVVPAPVPDSARFTYRISESGLLVGEIRLNVDPPQPCQALVYGRRSYSDLTNIGPVISLSSSSNPTILADRVNRVARARLQKSECAPNRRPYSFHIMAKIDCPGAAGPIFTNVFARQTNCGLEPELAIDEWQSQLVKRVGSVTVRRLRKMKRGSTRQPFRARSC